MNECTKQNKVCELSILEIGLRCAPREGMVNGTQEGSEFDWLQLFNIPGTDLELHIIEFDHTCGEKLAGIHPSKFIDFHYYFVPAQDILYRRYALLCVTFSAVKSQSVVIVKL